MDTAAPILHDVEHSIDRRVEIDVSRDRLSPGRNTEPRRATSVAVVIPCRNEELTVASVVQSFQKELPQATIYVFDNCSTDRTAERARDAGAVVLSEPRPGKGYVVQTMFQVVDADIYVMVDGDETYPARAVHSLLAPILSGQADMVVGSRLDESANSQFKSVNRFGNRLFLWVVNSVFRVRITDMLSGYRAFTRPLVKRLPLLGGGFEVETELTIRALDRGFRITEVPVDLVARPDGSYSKIRVMSDGMRILSTILRLFRDYKPLTFFGSLAIVTAILGLIPGTVVVVDFFRTGLVPRLPSAVLATGLEVMAMLLLSVGLVLHTIVAHAHELDVRLRLLAEEIVSEGRASRS